MVTLSINSGSTLLVTSTLFFRVTPTYQQELVLHTAHDRNDRLHTPAMTITELIKIQLSTHSAHMHIKLNFTDSAKAVLERGVYYFLSWTVPASSRMFAAAQYQLLSHFCRVPDLCSVKERQMFT
jgi:hypothetical protein